MFESGFHRLFFFFGIASCAVWFYAFHTWWGTVAAVLLCVPVGIAFALVAAMVLGTVRQVPGLSDAALTWLFLLGGTALGSYGFVAHDGVTRWLIALSGGALAVNGVGLLLLRLRAERWRAAAGEAPWVIPVDRADDK